MREKVFILRNSYQWVCNSSGVLMSNTTQSIPIKCIDFRLGSLRIWIDNRKIKSLCCHVNKVFLIYGPTIFFGRFQPIIFYLINTIFKCFKDNRNLILIFNFFFPCTLGISINFFILDVLIYMFHRVVFVTYNLCCSRSIVTVPPKYIGDTFLRFAIFLIPCRTLTFAFHFLNYFIFYYTLSKNFLFLI